MILFSQIWSQNYRVPRKTTVGIFGDSRSFRLHIEGVGVGWVGTRRDGKIIGKFEKEEIEKGENIIKEKSESKKKEAKATLFY